MNYSKKFLIIPKPKEDEFILSYLNRIKEENAYPSLNLVLKTIFGEKIKILNVVKGNFDKSALIEFVGINENLINKLCITDKNKFYCLSCILVCPYCITEKKYVSISGYQKNAMCSIHFIPYISRCPYCNKLLDWNAEKIERCQFCKNYIDSNINQYVLRNKETIHQSDIYFIFDFFFKLTINSPNLNDSYNLEYLSLGLQKSIDFINDPEQIILEKIRKIFIQIKVTYPNSRAIRYEFYLLIFNLIKIINKIHDGSHILNCLKKIIDENFIDEILKNHDQEYYQFINNYDHSFEKRTIKLNKVNISKILNLDIKIISILLDGGILRCDENKEVDFDDLTNFCNSIARNLNVDDVDEFVYLKNLHWRTQTHIFNLLLLSPFYLYNFKYDEMLTNIKIKKSDLNSLIYK